jgi:poly-beta-1,6-N-acetyl-D-glucosamine synthase
MHASYLLITPAKNEESHIGSLIESVVAQTVLPQKWVIVDDSSTDQTSAIANSYASRYEFIEVIRAGTEKDRNFSSKARAFRVGYERVLDVPHCFVGNLDADVTFDADYFEKLLHNFQQAPSLGVAGGLILEKIRGRYQAQQTSLNSVAGAVQLFRRKCFEDIGGYQELRSGGIDSLAEIMARMRGWDVRTFEDLHVLHHRQVTTGSGHVLATRFRQGSNHYVMGYGLLFQLASSAARLTEQPVLIGSIGTLAGYAFAAFQRKPAQVSTEVREYLRSEQRMRLRSFLQERPFARRKTLSPERTVRNNG